MSYHSAKELSLHVLDLATTDYQLNKVGGQTLKPRKEYARIALSRKLGTNSTIFLYAQNLHRAEENFSMRGFTVTLTGIKHEHFLTAATMTLCQN